MPRLATLISLLLLALLAIAPPVQATPLGIPDPLAVIDEEAEESEEGDEAEAASAECEEEAEEWLEECEEEEVEDELDESASDECLLRSAHARAVATPKGSKLKLTVGYTTYEPAAATIELHGGSVHGSIRRHLNRSGVLRIVKSLGKRRAPHRLVVRIRIPASPRSCDKRQTERVPVSKPGR